MKTNVFLGIGIRIVILFSIGLFMTFVPENLADFFGDYWSKPVKHSWGTSKSTLIWGARHYWYMTMMVLLFILSLVNVVISTVNLINTNYKDINF